MVSARRTKAIVRPRHVAMYLSRALTPRTLPEIGRRFGDRDHTTVLAAIRRIEGLMAQDEGIRDSVETLLRTLKGSGQ
jgi:chromosomal replication initiator protein